MLFLLPFSPATRPFLVNMEKCLPKAAGECYDHRQQVIHIATDLVNVIYTGYISAFEEDDKEMLIKP